MRLKLLALGAGLLLAACFSPPREPDCLFDRTCECKTTSQCPTGYLCVDGHCHFVVDAGQPGQLGYPCLKDSECTVGPCLPKGPGNGLVCTVVCNTFDGGTSCPKGWECKSAGSGSLCTPPLKALCLPCNDNSDCNAEGDLCLSLDAGHFCGLDCALSACPSGYQCRSLSLDGGQVVRQCVSDTGTCECSALTAGLKRSCSTKAPLGTCFGFETCQPNGVFSGCDARTASVEICNGIDDDCNGLTDQADPGLDHSGVAGFPNCKKGVSCTGLIFCGSLPDAGASFQCSAPDPSPETCNGVDDDCNGIVDDGLRDADGGYPTARACGECSNDCFVTLSHLALDAGPAAASCDNLAAGRTCVPHQCAKGYFPSPVAAPRSCQPAISSQCRPCTTSGDCVVPSDSCVQVGTDPGTACAQSCDPSSPYPGCTGAVGQRDCCPADNLCQSVGGKKQCVPTSSSCACTPGGTGFTRSCFKTAGAAICVGKQVCQPTGVFDTCDTSMTTVELCDGTDNDCNGVIDDGMINTQGTGTWDTDAHCGNCSTDCRARFSPTIQHAIGGCVVDGGSPGCHLVACTSQSVAGGGLCRIDSECTGGKTCSPTFHQCVHACSVPSDCASGESCSSGFCARNCNTTTDCTSAFGAPSHCTSNTCVIDYAFHNADLEESNGCECAAAQGVVDEPDTFPTYPTVGLPYVDRDCDNVDGTQSTSIFVWARSTQSLGTRTHPFATIRQALAAFSPGFHTAILVAQGTYVEQVVMVSGVSIYGGYSSDFSRRDVTSFPTFIEAPEPDWSLTSARRGSVNAEGLTGRTVLAGFTIRGYDVTSRPAAGQSARNSYAIYVKDSPALEVRNDHLVGGRGGDSVAATPGVAGASGAAGIDGLNAKECLTPLCTNETQNGGSGGVNSTCAGITQGNPGAGVNPSVDPQNYSGSNGDGTGGSNGIYEHSDPSQAALCKYDCTVPGTGLNGGPADNASSGLNAGGGPGCSASLGSVVGSEWVAGRGFGGAVGSTHGRGGGGGGGGGCVPNMNPPSCTIGNRVGDLGATGGGGGAGGCAGTSGGGGGGGGGSFALFVSGALPIIQGNLIDLGFGGFGGGGGAGGYGGLGGQGGRGGVNTTAAWCAGLGGPGGRGGTGGAGGGGGGGCGGLVAGIAGTGVAAANYPSKNTLAAPPINASGAGGTGGASPAGTFFAGTAGSPGAVQPVQSF